MNPNDAFKYEDILIRLKSTINDSKCQIFQSMIQSHLLENTHRVTVELYPSHTMEQEMIQV